MGRRSRSSEEKRICDHELDLLRGAILQEIRNRYPQFAIFCEENSHDSTRMLEVVPNFLVKMLPLGYDLLDIASF